MAEQEPDESVFSGIDYDSGIIWSDDPENAYFRSILNDQRDHREATGREIDDSLIGDSTLADLMDGDQTLQTFDPPQVKLTGSTALSLEADDTIDQFDAQPTKEVSPRDRALGWFSKRFSSHSVGDSAPMSPLVPKTSTSAGLISDSKTKLPAKENGKEVPGFIFVTGTHSSAVTTTSDPKAPDATDKTTGSTSASSTNLNNKKRCTKLHITLCFLTLCVILSVSTLAYLFRPYRGSSNSQGLTINVRDVPSPSPTSTLQPGDAESTSTELPTVVPKDANTPTIPQEDQETSSPTSIISTIELTSLPTSLRTNNPVVQPTPVPILTTATPTSRPTEPLLSRILSFSPSSSESLNNPSSPQRRALDWLLQDPNSPYDDMQTLQRWVLSTIFFSTSGSQWTLSTGWQSEMPECAWSEIGCDSEGRITNITLKDRNMIGSLPAEISLLSNSLTRVHFDSNQLSGPIPSEVGLLTNLEHIQLTRNSLTGSIPTEIGNLVRTRFLGVGRNSLFGSLPSELGLLTSLRTLDVSNNEVTGTIPSEFGSMTRLVTLTLGSNNLVGLVPPMLSQLQRLETLRLDRNSLTGEIPLSLCEPAIFPVMRADCNEVFCMCCSECCVDGFGCTSVVAITPADNTPSPTTRLTQGPSTAAPTESPTSWLTPAPSVKETALQLTLIPTSSSVVISTNGPTSIPTQATTFLTMDPISAPTLPVTISPTLAPVTDPTSAPTVPVTSSPTLTPVTSCSDTIQTDRQCYQNGDNIVIVFNNCNPHPDDWVGIYHQSADKQNLGEPIAWVWSCGDQLCQRMVDDGQVTFYRVHGRGRYIAFIIRQSEDGFYVPFGETGVFQVGESCVDSSALALNSP